MDGLLTLCPIPKLVSGTIFLGTKDGFASKILRTNISNCLKHLRNKCTSKYSYLAALVSSKKNFNSESLTRNGILQGTVSMIELLGL